MRNPNRPSFAHRMGEKAFKIGMGIAVVTGTAEIIPANEYVNSGLHKETAGGEKNAVATLISGIIGQKIYGSSKVDINVEKMFWPDSKITGETTPDSINVSDDNDTNVDLKKSTDDLSSGEIDKGGVDWDIKQTGPNTYKIENVGPFNDATLIVEIKNGKIIGTYKRPFFDLNWTVGGSYRTDGTVNIVVNVPLGPDIELDGTIEKK